MSTEKKLPPIQSQPMRPFTVRLVNGHFVRVPKVELIAVTDATRPPSTVREETSPHGDGTVITRRLRLVNGRFVGGATPASEPVPVALPVEMPLPTSDLPRPVTPEPSADSWAYAFSTQLDPSDSPPKT